MIFEMCNFSHFQDVLDPLQLPFVVGGPELLFDDFIAVHTFSLKVSKKTPTARHSYDPQTRYRLTIVRDE